MNPFSRHVVAGTILWAAAIFVALMSMTSGELTASEQIPTPATSDDFTYFPSQYVNQATGPSEHIQAF